MGARSEGTMRVHVHTKFCFLCVLTFLLQCIHCHIEGQHQGDHQGDHHHGDNHGDHHGDGHAHEDLQISQAPYVGGAPTPSAATGVDMLAEEQRYYIQQLFRRYGTQDRLDFQGFQSLLVSLGLGEVKVVGVEHEELGHDHVAHLDVLDVQDGLHSHLPAKDHGKAGHHHPHVKPAVTKCSRTGGGDGGASPTADHGSQQDHNHTHNHNGDPAHSHEVQDQHKHSDSPHKGHTHNHTNGHGHKHGHGHGHHKGHTHAAAVVPADGEATSPPDDHEHDHEGDHEHPQQTQSTANASSARPELLPTARTETPIVAQQQKPEAAPLESKPPASMTESQTRRSRKPPRERGQRGRNKTSSSSSPSSSSSSPLHSLASNRRRREALGGPLSPTSSTPSLSDHLGGVAHQHKECLNLTLLLRYYGLTPASQISQVQFTYLCPALLYQIDSRVCIRHYGQLEVEQTEVEHVSSGWVWLWGFVSITIISLLSLLGVILVPILNQSCFKFLLTFLVALAVGTLSGDALLHLLPHSQGEHTHGEPLAAGEEVEEDWMIKFDGVWKGLTALGGIYLLFVIEHCISMVKHYKDKGGTFCARKSRRGEEAKIGRKLSDHKLNRRSDAEWLNLKHMDQELASDSVPAAVSCDNGHNDTQLTELQSPDSPRATHKEDGVHKEKKRGHSHGHGHSHGGNCHTDQEMKEAGIASIAWMVIMGDGMHNFSDGLAIGAAFSANITGGISTSVAVFCHELPHELGDFAVLLKAGMSVKQAIAYNLLSALMAYFGMIIGTAVGQYTHNVTSWIFAVTAGMFLYVALVDMLPEMLHGDSEEHKRCQLGHFLLQNLGLMTGFFIMLLIAIFEDQIVFDFGFL